MSIIGFYPPGAQVALTQIKSMLNTLALEKPEITAVSRTKLKHLSIFDNKPSSTKNKTYIGDELTYNKCYPK